MSARRTSRHSLTSFQAQFLLSMSHLLFDDTENLRVRHGLRGIQTLLELHDVPCDTEKNKAFTIPSIATGRG